MAGNGPVFDDVIVSATLLNRRSGEILDQAWEKCVTIMRNEQAFALLRREDAAEMTALLRCAQKIVEMFHALELMRSGSAIDPANEFEWISAFTLDDLMDMAREVYSAYARAASREAPTAQVDALIHEWQESAWALRSADVRAAFDATADEVPATEPAGYAGK
jgi:purine nucleoside permease